MWLHIYCAKYGEIETQPAFQLPNKLTSCTIKAGKLLSQIPLQLRFWMQNRLHHLDALTWDLKCEHNALAKLLPLESIVGFSAKAFYCPAIISMGERERYNDIFLIPGSQTHILKLSSPNGDFLFPHLENGGRRPWAKKCEQTLEASNDKNIYLPLSFQKGWQNAYILILAQCDLC